MQFLYKNDSEYQKHSSAIHKLAEQYHEKESLVREIYETALKEFLLSAKFRRYLPILVTRKVSERLRDNHR